MEVIGKNFQVHLNKVLPTMRNILQSAHVALASTQQDLSDVLVIPFWKEAYYSLVMLQKILTQFHNLFLDKELEVQLTILSVIVLQILFLFYENAENQSNYLLFLGNVFTDILCSSIGLNFYSLSIQVLHS